MVGLTWICIRQAPARSLVVLHASAFIVVVVVVELNWFTAQTWFVGFDMLVAIFPSFIVWDWFLLTPFFALCLVWCCLCVVVASEWLAAMENFTRVRMCREQLLFSREFPGILLLAILLASSPAREVPILCKNPFEAL